MRGVNLTPLTQQGGAVGIGGSLLVNGGKIRLQGRMAEWSKALESGCHCNLSSPKGRGFEPHFCHPYLFILLTGFSLLQKST